MYLQNVMTYMKCKVMILLLGLVPGLLSCDNEGTEGPMVQVSLVADIASTECLYSRAANAEGDEMVTRCLMEVMLDGQSKSIETLSGNEQDGFAITLKLLKDKEYQFYFWADRGNDYYDATDFTQIAVAQNAEPSVAYSGSLTLTATEKNLSQKVTLNHAVAKVSVVTTTELESGNALSMTIPKICASYNARTLASNESSASKTYSTTLTTDIAANATVMSAYGFVDGTNQTVKIKYAYAPEIEVTNVPIALNTHTKLVGDISGQAQVMVTAEVSDTWLNDELVNYDPVEDVLDPDKEVDLGLSVIWAKCNLGASTPEEAGDFYQWGSPDPTNNGNIHTGHYDFTGNWYSEDDPATLLLGPGWRVPTLDEWQELLTLPKTIDNYNVTITNSATGESIYLPDTRIWVGNTYDTGNYYWTANSLDNTNKYSYSAERSKEKSRLYNAGLRIRPVRDKQPNL